MIRDCPPRILVFPLHCAGTIDIDKVPATPRMGANEIICDEPILRNYVLISPPNLGSL